MEQKRRMHTHTYLPDGLNAAGDGARSMAVLTLGILSPRDKRAVNSW
jgi:hypothetical protein